VVVDCNSVFNGDVFVSDIAIFVLKRDLKLQLTNYECVFSFLFVLLLIVNKYNHFCYPCDVS